MIELVDSEREMQKFKLRVDDDRISIVRFHIRIASVRSNPGRGKIIS